MNSAQIRSLDVGDPLVRMPTEVEWEQVKQAARYRERAKARRTEFAPLDAFEAGDHQPPVVVLGVDIGSDHHTTTFMAAVVAAAIEGGRNAGASMFSLGYGCSSFLDASAEKHAGEAVAPKDA